MPNQETINNQQELLAIHRRRLAEHLKQQASLGKAFAPPAVADGIRDARDSIQRIKAILRRWSVAVEDQPDDEDPDVLRQTRIFISYKRDVTPDEPVALQVFQALSRQHEIFIDQTMPAGTLWAERIKTEIYHADYVIVFLSAHAISSQMVELEIATAHQLAQLQGGRPKILPVRLAHREPFQYPLSEYLNHLNWASWESSQDTLRLIEELGRAVAGEDLLIRTPESKARLIQVSAPAPVPQPTPSAQPRSLELPEGTMDLRVGFLRRAGVRPARAGDDPAPRRNDHNQRAAADGQEFAAHPHHQCGS